MPGSEYIIKYISDLTEATAGAKELERVNADMAKTITNNFQQATRFIGTSLDKVSETPVTLKGGEETIKTITQLGTIIQTADGSFKEFTKTQTFVGEKLEKTTGSLRDITSQFRVQSVEMEKATKPFLSIIGQSSQLATNFENLQNVNQRFANELKEFGQATEVVDSGLVKVAGGTQKLEAIVSTTDGKFIKLNETIKQTPDGMQQISRQATDITDKYRKLGDSQEMMVVKSSQLKTNFSNLSDIGAKFSHELTGMGNVTKIVGQNINQVSGNVSKVGFVIQTANGKFLQLTETSTRSSDGIQTVNRSLKDVTDQFAKTDVATAKAQKNFIGLGENLGRLAKRALITIPIWLALRSAMMGTFRVIKDGLKTIEEQDRAFQKAKRTLQGTTSEIERNYNKLRESVTKLSLETGESVEKITNAFYKFSTVGFDFETAMKGAEYATKTAIVMFGDAEETANAFARAMRVLVDTSEGAKPAGDQIAEAMALTAELWKTNAFELNEFTQSLEKFAGTAKATNFTTQQTVALLASLSTAGLRGGRAGTLLRSSIVKLLTNLDKLSGTLGVRVNPQLDSTFDVLMRVLDAIQGLDEGSQVAEQTANAIGKIFGGVRGMEAVLALKALREEMIKNIQTVGGVDKLNEEFSDITNTVSRQIDIFHNLNKEIGKSLITGIVGGDDFLDTLHKINETLESMSTRSQKVGRALNRMFTGKQHMIFFDPIFDAYNELEKRNQSFFENLTKGLRGELDATVLEDLIKNLKVNVRKNNIFLADDALFHVEGQLRKRLQEISDKSSIKVDTEVVQRKLTIEEGQDIAKLILSIELDRLKVLGATNSQLLKAESLYSRQLNIEESSLDKVKRKLELEKSIAEEKRLQNRLSEESLQLFRLATGQVEIDKTPKSEFQKIGDEMSAVFSDISQSISPSIQKEKIGQTIGKDAGYEMAIMFSKVLKQEISMQDFFGRATQEQIQTFEKLFPGKIEQAQAEQFFRGERVVGLPGVVGGTRIEIAEETIRNFGMNVSRVITQNLKAQKEFMKLETKDMQIVRPDKVEIIGWDRPEELRGALTLDEKMHREMNIERARLRAMPETLTERNISPSETKIGINFSDGSFTIHGQTKEEQLQEINKAFINLGTPGTKENQQLNKAITGNKQTPVL